ncbi:MAG: hypothetical protein WCT32_01565 [Patescibacteria group bacterium]|jgi:hypothetical protein
MRRNYDTALLIINKFLSDKEDVYLFLASILLTAFDLVLWKMYQFSETTAFLWRLSLSPIYFLLITIGINIVLSLFASDKDENISHLLLAANIFIATLILILEIFYSATLQ